MYTFQLTVERRGRERGKGEGSSDSFETSHGGNPVIASGPVSTTIHSNFEATE